MGIEGSFWRAIAVYRIASLGYAALLLAGAGGYQRPVAGWLVFGVMAVWTAVTTVAYSTARSRPLLVVDVLVTLGCMLASPYVQGECGRTGPDAGHGDLGRRAGARLGRVRRAAGRRGRGGRSLGR